MDDDILLEVVLESAVQHPFLLTRHAFLANAPYVAQEVSAPAGDGNSEPPLGPLRCDWEFVSSVREDVLITMPFAHRHGVSCLIEPFVRAGLCLFRYQHCNPCPLPREPPSI